MHLHMIVDLYCEYTELINFIDIDKIKFIHIDKIKFHEYFDIFSCERNGSQISDIIKPQHG